MSPLGQRSSLVELRVAGATQRYNIIGIFRARPLVSSVMCVERAFGVAQTAAVPRLLVSRPPRGVPTVTVKARLLIYRQQLPDAELDPAGINDCGDVLEVIREDALLSD